MFFFNPAKNKKPRASGLVSLSVGLLPPFCQSQL
jgi:hypothetical protein